MSHYGRKKYSIMTLLDYRVQFVKNEASLTISVLSYGLWVGGTGEGFSSVSVVFVGGSCLLLVVGCRLLNVDGCCLFLVAGYRMSGVMSLGILLT